MFAHAVLAGWSAVLLCVPPIRAAAQDVPVDRSRLIGDVRGPDDKPVSGATVKVYGSTRAATTDGKGGFALYGLPKRTHIVEVLALGFRPRLLALYLTEDTAPLTIDLERAIVLDSIRVEDTAPFDVTKRRTDRITESELAQRDVVGGSALDAFAVLRPQLFAGRSAGLSPTTDASTRSQMYVRDDGMSRRCMAGRVCEIDGRLSVSINEGRPASPDILSLLPARVIREMRYLQAVEASARFGLTSGGGPVLVIYTK